MTKPTNPKFETSLPSKGLARIHSRSLLTSIITSLALSCLVHAEVLETWIVAGQSNAEGYGITESPVSGLTPASTLSTIGRTDLNVTHSNIQMFQGANEYSGITASAGMTLPAKNVWHSMNAQEGLAYDWGAGRGSESGRRFGPELAFGYDVQAQIGARIALIKYARGSASIASSATQSGGVWLDYDPSDAGRLNHYDKLITTIQTAVNNLPAGQVLNVRGIVWMQGEGDATASFAPAYQANLTEFITTLRNDIGTIADASGGKMTRSASAWSKLDVFLGTIQNSGANHQTVINAQNAVAAADANVSTVNATTGLSLMTVDDWGASGVHYDTAGQVLLGERFADAAMSAMTPSNTADSFGNGTIKIPTTASGGTGTVANIQSDDDLNYEVAKSATANIGGFGTFNDPISSVYLFVQYTVEPGYTGTNAIQVNGVNTTIAPAVRDYGRWAYVDITGGAFGINTSAEISTMSVTFNNNHGGTTKSVLFDCAYVVVNPQTTIPTPPTWSEDFNGTGAANPMVWQYEVGKKRNPGQTEYVAGASNGWQEGGNFVIEGRKESVNGSQFTTAGILTQDKYYWKYGRAQIRAKIPCLPGMWPAIWGTGEVGQWPHNGEVDIMEFYDDKILANCAVGTTQAWGTKWDTATRSMTSLASVDANWRNQWHIWTMQWDDQNVRLYVDNYLMNTIPQTWLKNDDGYNTSWGPQYPFISNGMNCWLNLAIGEPAESATATMNNGPHRFLIDYWKVWEGATNNVAPTDIAVSGNGVIEGQIGAVVGNLSATDADPAEVHSYALVAGAGDTHNSSFTISSFVSDSTTKGILYTTTALNYINSPTRSIRVRVTDIEGATYEKALTINVIRSGQHVQYNGNGKTAGTPPTDPIGYPEGTSVTVLGSADLVRTGYTFAGWNTASNGSGTTYQAGSTFAIGATDVVLYAKWNSALTYTISYSGNGQTSGTAPTNQTKTHSVDITLATNSGNLARTGYTFAGWNTLPDGSGTNYPVSFNYTSDANLTLYAKWNTTPVANAGLTQMVSLSEGQSWTPASITPAAWYDAADASSIAHVSGAVSQWNDKSGNGRHVVQPTSANRPTYSASSWNGSSLPALTFDGTSDYLENASQFVSASMTIVAVYDQANTNNTSRPFGVRNGGSTKASFAFGSDNSLRYDGTYTAGTIAASVGKHLRVAGRTTSVQTDHVDGTSNISAAVVLPNVDGNINIGNTLSTLAGYFSSKVAETIIIPGTVNQATREQIEGYLAHKWALTANLPALHPYKSIPPTTSAATAILAGSASDSEGDALTTTWSMLSGPATVTFSNALALNSTATFPVAGTYTLRLTVSDGYSQSTSDVVITVDLASGNTAPVFTVTPITGTNATEGSPYTATLAGSATDADGNSLTYAKVSGPAWLTVASNGGLSGTPTQSNVGTNTFTISVSDGIAAPVTTSLNITVNNVNNAPIFTANPITGSVATEDAAYTATLVGSATDADGNSLTYAKVSGAAWLSVASNGGLSGTPTQSNVGANAFTISVSDGIAAPVTATLNITVNNVNDAPVFAVSPITGTTAIENAPYTATLAGSATDADGNSLTYAKVSGPAWLTVATNGSLAGTPTTGDVGVNSFTVSVTDSIAAPIVATLNITVNAASGGGTPTLGHVSNIHISNSTDFNISVYPGKAGYAGTGSYAGVTGAFGDGTVEAYYFLKNQTPATTLNGADGVVGTPVRYADDGSTLLSNATNTGGTSFSEFSRGDVWTTNDPGTNFSGGGAANFGGAAETICGAYQTTGTIDISGFTSGTIYFLAGGYSSSGQTSGFNLTMSGAGQTNVLASNSFVPTTSRNMYVQSFTFSNAENYDTISYTHFGTTSGRSRIMGVIVDGVSSSPPSNSAPAWASNPITGSNASEDTAYSGSIASSATDTNNDPLTFAKVSGPAWLSVASDGTLSGTPAQSNVGTNSFTLSVSDGIAAPVVTTLNIIVVNVNDAPIANAQNVNTTEDTGLSITLAATDVDGDTLTYSVVTQPTNGTLTGTAPNLSYTPTTNYNGADSFTFRANDGLVNSATVTVAITVTPVNDAPLANSQSVTATEDNTKSITLLATDIDGDPLTYSIVTQPSNGTLSGTAPNVIFTPTANFSGATSFTFRVNDGTVNSTTATVSITVTSVNDAPVFLTNPIIAVNASEGAAYTGVTLAGGVTDSDAGDTITFSKVSGPAWLAIASNGTLSGTPPSGSTGLNSFVVRATDSASATADATLEITVVGLPLPWITTDIGTGMLAGSASYNAGTFTQTGSGVIAGTGDTLRYTYQTLTGDGEIIARISNLQNTGSSSRIGVMIRESLAANSKEIFMGMASSNSYRWVRRTTTGGNSSSTTSSTGTVPNTWARLVRSGTTITAYKSTNGTTWTTVGSTTNTTFASTCYIGIAVGSGSTTTLNTSQFSNVSVTP
jgi:uncharacterized repeat protein (TIGR02543 family)